MKVTLLLFCVFCATAMFAQYGSGVPVLSNQPQPIYMPGHPQHASQHAMSMEHAIVGTYTVTYARGERSASELTPKVVVSIPLGDTARVLRKEHEAAKKAEKLWEN